LASHLAVLFLLGIIFLVPNTFLKVKGANVSGMIDTNTTWDLDGSPYIVTGNVTVAEGATLTIEPGVRIRFDDHHGIYVEGSLHIRGTESNRINMTSNKMIPEYGDWRGIFINSTGYAEIRHTDISYGGSIRFDSSNNIFVNNSLSNSLRIYIGRGYSNVVTGNDISYNKEGICICGWWGSSSNYIANNTISYNDGYGIIIDSSKNEVIHNTILSNNEGGIVFGGWAPRNKIIRNNILLNKGIGIFLFSKWNNLHHNNIIDNTIQVIDLATRNFWNGNYWSDYSPECQDLYNGSTPQVTGLPDGFCDYPYDVNVTGTDFYPLKKPVDLTPPTITNLLPIDTIINYSSPLISVDYEDFAGVNASSIILTVDGIDVSTSAIKTMSRVSYAPTIPFTDGVHNVYIEVKDNIGNVASTTWSFTVDTTSPIISNLHPFEDSIINNSKPIISLNYSDSSGIDVNSVLIEVDGLDVTSLSNVTPTGVTYAPISVLQDGSHRIRVEVSDIAGNIAKKSWNFYIDTIPTPSLERSQWGSLVLVILIVILLVCFFINIYKRKSE